VHVNDDDAVTSVQVSDGADAKGGDGADAKGGDGADAKSGADDDAARSADNGDQFEFYPCIVDGEPASIYVNLRYEAARPSGADTRYSVEMRMTDAGPHGIGTAEEAEAINAIEEGLIETLGAVGLVYVGRIRNRGTWDAAFYGPAGQVDAVRAAVPKTRHAQTRSEADPEWRYYTELLLPDAERRQWGDDRRLVQILKEQGDILSTPRRVDHWATFETAAARDAFVEIAVRAGFTRDVEPADDLSASRVPDNDLSAARVPEGDRSAAGVTDGEARSAAGDDLFGTRGDRFGARVHRVDPIELEHIHDAVMILVDAATKVGGAYDGWECPIESGT
jgi:hypothetical protein